MLGTIIVLRSGDETLPIEIMPIIRQLHGFGCGAIHLDSKVYVTEWPGSNVPEILSARQIGILRRICSITISGIKEEELGDQIKISLTPSS